MRDRGLVDRSSVSAASQVQLGRGARGPQTRLRRRTFAAADLARRRPGDVRHAVGTRAFDRVLARGRAQWGVCPFGRVRTRGVRHFQGAFSLVHSLFVLLV